MLLFSVATVLAWFGQQQLQLAKLENNGNYNIVSHPLRPLSNGSEILDTASEGNERSFCGTEEGQMEISNNQGIRLTPASGVDTQRFQSEKIPVVQENVPLVHASPIGEATPPPLSAMGEAIIEMPHLG